MLKDTLEAIMDALAFCGAIIFIGIIGFMVYMISPTVHKTVNDVHYGIVISAVANEMENEGYEIVEKNIEDRELLVRKDGIVVKWDAVKEEAEVEDIGFIYDIKKKLMGGEA